MMRMSVRYVSCVSFAPLHFACAEIELEHQSSLDPRQHKALSFSGPPNLRPTPKRTAFRQFLLLMQRSLRHLARDPALLLAHMIVTLAVALFVGGVFWQLDNKIPGIQNRTGFFFFMAVYFSLTSMSCLSTFISDRNLAHREQSAGFYTSGPYFFANILSDMVPLRLFPPFLFALITYFMVGLQDSPEKFLIFIAALVLLSCTSSAMCLWISAMVDSVGQANFLAVIIFIFSLMFGGLLLNADSDTSVLVKLTYASFIHYGYEALMANEFHGLDLIFNPKDFPETAISGDVILSNNGMRAEDLGRDMWVLAIFLTGFLTLALVTVKARGRARM